MPAERRAPPAADYDRMRCNKQEQPHTVISCEKHFSIVGVDVPPDHTMVVTY